MARKYIPKSSYCRGSHLEDPVFEDILLFFVGGIPADTAHKAMTKLHPQRVNPHEKTIRRHYRAIGDALFERFLVPLWLPHPAPLESAVNNAIAEDLRSAAPALEKYFVPAGPNSGNPPDEKIIQMRAYLADVRRTRPDLYELALEKFLIDMHHETLKGGTSPASVEYRKLSGSKNGIHASIRAHMALSHILGAVGVTKKHSKVAGAAVHVEMDSRFAIAIWLRDHFSRHPCKLAQKKIKLSRFG